ncbi:hypothetical protein DO97_01035 [Neosynechococcus sphagnicola sy1]|uniref:Uncharacterized protein n=1 Tax=Neosynechococcus sphagnicola sy1 TaxID=1497020 RepID=A0A098TLQ7_9CYAN|nr:hypothetical protein [Neosynechococcus sphagnicola]KGF73244.1 hypothetical protein DO97_01035 [Neosynechococcus sphagnicola sy1]
MPDRGGEPPTTCGLTGALLGLQNGVQGLPWPLPLAPNLIQSQLQMAADLLSVWAGTAASPLASWGTAPLVAAAGVLHPR